MNIKKSADHRIFFVGDSFTQGVGDPEYRGWVGRVAAAAYAKNYDVTVYNLGVRRDTSRDILARWEAECDVRYRINCEHYVVFSFGANDMAEESGNTRISQHESLENFSKIISEAKKKYNVCVIGSPPGGDRDHDKRILDLCGGYENYAAKLGVPYIPTTAKLMADPIWLQSVKQVDGIHPGAEGYELIAELVLGSPQWWFS